MESWGLAPLPLFYVKKIAKRKISRPSKKSPLSSRSPFSNANLIPRVSHLTTPWSSLAPGDGKIRDPGNEATSTAINVEQLACFELKGTPKQFIGVLTAVF